MKLIVGLCVTAVLIIGVHILASYLVKLVSGVV